jgi:cell cycle checkpoint protein
MDEQTLYSDSPIDSSLFGLYIHQNYAQFCDGVEHCEGVSEWLSWVDWSGGEDVCHFLLSQAFRGRAYV